MLHKLSWQCYTPRTESIATKPTGEAATPNIPVHPQNTFFIQRRRAQACSRTLNHESFSCACTRSFKKDCASTCKGVPRRAQAKAASQAQAAACTRTLTHASGDSPVDGPSSAIARGRSSSSRRCPSTSTADRRCHCPELQPITDDRLRCPRCYLRLHRGKRRHCTLSVALCRKQRKKLAGSEPIWIQRCLAFGACSLP
jgi:hypothetical protein